MFNIRLVIQNSFYNQWRRIAPEYDSSCLGTDIKDWSNNMPSGILSLLRWIKKESSPETKSSWNCVVNTQLIYSGQSLISPDPASVFSWVFLVWFCLDSERELFCKGWIPKSFEKQQVQDHSLLKELNWLGLFDLQNLPRKIVFVLLVSSPLEFATLWGSAPCAPSDLELVSAVLRIQFGSPTGN